MTGLPSRIVPVVYLRLPPALKLAVERAAKQHGMSVNTFVTRLIERECAAPQARVRRAG